MRSGKSKALIDIADKLNGRYLAFKPAIDTRDGAYITTRENRKSIPATIVYNTSQLLEYSWEPQDKKKPQAILIDEISLFSSDIITVRDSFTMQGIDIYAAGLDRDYLARWFQLSPGEFILESTMQEVISDYQEKHSLTAKCEICGKPAHYTQRLRNGKPVKHDIGLIEIGDAQYRPVCGYCKGS